MAMSCCCGSARNFSGCNDSSYAPSALCTERVPLVFLYFLQKGAEALFFRSMNWGNGYSLFRQCAMTQHNRFLNASRAAFVHLFATVLIVLAALALVLGIWFPYPYDELSGGLRLFWLMVVANVICGPSLTVLLFNNTKSRAELWRDLGMVTFIQIFALGYGLFTLVQARPLFLALEKDRFKVIIAADIDHTALDALPLILQPSLLSGPIVVALREPKNTIERNNVLFESVQGGRDYAERPEFYLPYKGDNALKSLNKAKPLALFLQKQPSQLAEATKLAETKGADMSLWLYLPVIARQDWIAVLDQQGQIQGFLKGDGF